MCNTFSFHKHHTPHVSYIPSCWSIGEFSWFIISSAGIEQLLYWRKKYNSILYLITQIPYPYWRTIKIDRFFIEFFLGWEIAIRKSTSITIITTTLFLALGPLEIFDFLFYGTEHTTCVIALREINSETCFEQFSTDWLSKSKWSRIQNKRSMRNTIKKIFYVTTILWSIIHSAWIIEKWIIEFLISNVCF